MIKLTAPDGSPVEVRPEAIDEIAVNHGTFDAKAKSILLINGRERAVRESVQQIDALLAGHRGKQSK